MWRVTKYGSFAFLLYAQSSQNSKDSSSSLKSHYEGTSSDSFLMSLELRHIFIHVSSSLETEGRNSGRRLTTISAVQSCRCGACQLQYFAGFNDE